MSTVCLAEHIITSLSTQVQQALHRGCFEEILSFFCKAMNGLIQNHGFQVNYLQNPPSGLVPQQYMNPNAGNPFVLAQHQLNTGLSLASLPPQQQLQLRAQLQGLGRVLMQRQFMQNFSFANSDFYHQIPHVDDSKKTLQFNQVDPAYSEVCSNIKEEILKQLSGESKCTALDNFHIDSDKNLSREEACATLLPSTVVQPTTKQVMESRGTKRQLDINQSPNHKRTRSESDDIADSSILGGLTGPESVESPNYASTDQSGNSLGFYWPGQNQKKDMDMVTKAIWKYFETRHQTQDVYHRKMQLREALYAVTKGVFPYCGLYVVGSSMNGFGNKTSDMDMCLMLSQAEIDQKKEAMEILRCLLKALRKCSFLTNITLIRAKVPILKFTDRISGVEVDLNINNSVGIRNTHLLNAYARLDWRVAPLVLFVKYWACQQNINDASQGTISSYSLVLMVIHYLQSGCNPPVLPSLQQLYPNKFSVRQDVRLLTLNEKLPDFKSRNSMSLGELFTGFLQYYSHKFDFEKCAISVRLGRTIPRNLAVSQTPSNPNQWKCLCIEEPFDLSNTARSVYDHHIFMRCRRIIRSSFGQLRQSGDIHRLLYNPV